MRFITCFACVLLLRVSLAYSFFRIPLTHSGSLLVEKDTDGSTRDLTMAIDNTLCLYLPVDLTVAVSLMLLSVIWVLEKTGKSITRLYCNEKRALKTNHVQS